MRRFEGSGKWPLPGRPTRPRSAPSPRPLCDDQDIPTPDRGRPAGGGTTTPHGPRHPPRPAPARRLRRPQPVAGGRARRQAPRVGARAQRAVARGASRPGRGSTQTRDQLRAILDSKEQIPGVVRRGDWFWNFWRDDKNPRGLWRRTTLEEYRKPQPAWDVVIDLDALAKQENENWVWHGAALPRAEVRALPGDAVARRLRRAGRARVRHRQARVRRRRLRAARGQVQRRLDRRGHDLRRHRFRRRQPHRLRLPERRQALVARHAAGQRHDDVQGRARGRRVGHERGRHARLRAHHVQPLARLLHLAHLAAGPPRPRRQGAAG